MERKTKKVELPISGYTAHIAEWYTTEERDAIQEVLMEGAEVSFDEERGTQVQDLPSNFTIKQARERVKAALRKLEDEDGEEVEITPKVLGGLPAEDTDFILENLPDAPKNKKK